MVDLLFRNVDVNVADPVETWPAEAIRTAIERGSLAHWSAIAAAISREPWGPVARIVEEIIDDDEPYGVGPGLGRVIASARKRRVERERSEVAAELRDLVTRSGLPAGQFASRVGTSASRLSTYLSGQVVPSATFLVRARTVTRR